MNCDLVKFFKFYDKYRLIFLFPFNVPGLCCDSVFMEFDRKNSLKELKYFFVYNGLIFIIAIYTNGYRVNVYQAISNRFLLQSYMI